MGVPTRAPTSASPRAPLLAGDVRPREVWAWSMYDFANSGYTTVVITAVFSAYFVDVVAQRAPWATFAWTAALSASYAAVLLTAPFIGAWADARAAKKALLALATVGCVAFTAALSLASPGAVALAIGLIVASNFFFAIGENLIAAFLPELANAEAMGRVSGWGWGFGYLGGIVSLGTSLACIQWAEAQGHSAAQFVPMTMLVTATIFALASAPTFVFLRERARPQPAAGNPWARVLDTLRHAARFRDLRRFLVCLAVYQAGVQAVVALAAIYAQQAMGFTTAQTVVLVLVVNLTAAAGAFAFGFIQDRIGHRRAIALTLAGWIATVGLAWFAEGPALFWVAANLAGLSMGSSQAAGRALVGYLAPPARLGEFFGLWGLAMKAAAIVGPLTYGAVTWVFAGNHRLAMLAVGAYFLVGLLLLGGIDPARGRRAALEADNGTRG